MAVKTIEVKKKHILNGQCASPTFCAVALALLDAGFDHTLVDSNSIFINGYGYDTPKKVSKFIERFDLILNKVASRNYDKYPDAEKYERKLKRQLKPFSFRIRYNEHPHENNNEY